MLAVDCEWKIKQKIWYLITSKGVWRNPEPFFAYFFKNVEKVFFREENCCVC